jgi:hypothetical protein
MVITIEPSADDLNVRRLLSFFARFSSVAKQASAKPVYSLALSRGMKAHPADLCGCNVRELCEACKGVIAKSAAIVSSW